MYAMRRRSSPDANNRTARRANNRTARRLNRDAVRNHQLKNSAVQKKEKKEKKKNLEKVARDPRRAFDISKTKTYINGTTENICSAVGCTSPALANSRFEVFVYRGPLSENDKFSKVSNWCGSHVCVRTVRTLSGRQYQGYQKTPGYCDEFTEPEPELAEPESAVPDDFSPDLKFAKELRAHIEATERTQSALTKFVVEHLKANDSEVDYSEGYTTPVYQEGNIMPSYSPTSPGVIGGYETPGYSDTPSYSPTRPSYSPTSPSYSPAELVDAPSDDEGDKV